MGFRIKDLGSTNGTKLNRVKMKEKCWVEGNIGDTVRVGATTLQIVTAEDLCEPIVKLASKRKK